MYPLILFWRSSRVRPNSPKKDKFSPQRKTTLKWGSDGELSSIDMARILDKLAKSELTECDLACKIEEND